MRRILALLLALLMMGQCVCALAEPAGGAAAEAALPDDGAEGAAAEIAGVEGEASGAAGEVAGAEEEASDAEAEGDAEAGEEALPPIEYDYDELTVGTVTPFDGKFYTQMWGNVSSDLDVRMLVHGYNLVEWRSDEDVFAVDTSVVSGIVVTENSEGDRMYTLTLYDDLVYSDGTPITAWDYAFSLLLSIAPEVDEIGGRSRPLDYLVGYSEYERGEASALAGVRVFSDYALAFLVSHEYLPFFYELALLDCTPSPIAQIAPGCRVADDGEGIYIANEDETLQAPVFTAELLRQTLLDPETGYLSHPAVTSGPYRLLSFDGDEVRLEANPYFKGNSDGELPRIERLIFREVTNDTMIEALSTGEVGLLTRCVSASTLQAGTRLVASGRGFAMDNYTRNGMAFFSFCCEREAVSSAAVRRAIAMCLDKDELVADVVRNYGLRVDGYYGMGQWMAQLVDGTQAYPVEEPELDADQAAHDAYDAAIAEWEALSLDDVALYELDEEQAAALLAEDGWTLNRDGEPFDPAADDVRCKAMADGSLLALELTLASPEGGSVNDWLDESFIDHLANVGVKLTVEILPMEDLLDLYYRRQPRTCDMIFLATNFDIVFDPSVTFMPDGETPNLYNTTALDDQALYELARAMRQTNAHETLLYCQRWVEFQKRFQELEPMIPIYTNVYFDFFPWVLHNYDISGNVTWAQAIVGAYMSDMSDEEETVAETEARNEVVIEYFNRIPVGGQSSHHRRLTLTDR